jgi:hypothetical protein
MGCRHHPDYGNIKLREIQAFRPSKEKRGSKKTIDKVA